MGGGHLGPSVDRGVLFALVFFISFVFFFGPFPWVTKVSYYHLILGVGIKLFTYS